MLHTLKISRDEAFARYWKLTDGVVQMRIKDGHCVFYDNGCTVHQGRPWRCRQWPLVPAILKDRVNLETIRKSCPGLQKDQTYEDVCAAVRRANSLDRNSE